MTPATRREWDCLLGLHMKSSFCTPLGSVIRPGMAQSIDTPVAAEDRVPPDDLGATASEKSHVMHSTDEAEVVKGDSSPRRCVMGFDCAACESLALHLEQEASRHNCHRQPGGYMSESESELLPIRVVKLRRGRASGQQPLTSESHCEHGGRDTSIRGRSIIHEREES